MPFHLESLWGHVNAAQMVCDGLGRNKIVRWAKAPVRFKAICGPKFMEFWNLRTFDFERPCPIVNVTFHSRSRWKPNKCKTFLTPISFGGTTPTVLRQTGSALYRPPFGKVWLSSVSWGPSAKPGNEVDNLRRVGKMTVQFQPFVDQSSWHLIRCRRFFVVLSVHLPDYVYHVSSEDIGR